jgi:2-amino-4-hydroxy-6-hydroxymethyldihydropteridine diphosphokinase
VTRAFLALGSNLGDREAHLAGALRALDGIVAVSPVYETAPVGGPEQDDYLNVVVELDTDRSARELLADCARLEAAAGRVREERWGPRTLDVDIVWIDGVTVDEPDLQVPHPRMGERRFVLAPLRDLAPDLVSAAALAAATGEVTERGPLAWRAPRRIRIIGPGRAGTSFAGALEAAGWDVAAVLGRDDTEAVAAAAEDVDLVLLAPPDAAVAAVAHAVRPVPGTVVAHVAGSLGLDVLAPHVRRAAVHPLVALPNGDLGARRLRAGAWFAVAGDPLAGEVVAALDGRSFAVADGDRAGYHAAACIASNHLVALMGSVERVAGASGPSGPSSRGSVIPLDAFLDLAAATIDNVRALRPAAALTGPAARGDDETIERHRAYLAARAPGELEAYDALVALARRLVRP